MQDDFRIFGNGKSSETTKKHQHHKFPSGLGYPKPEGRDEGESYTRFRTLPQEGFSLIFRRVKLLGLRVKYTPEIGFNLLKFIPLYHIIRL